MMDIKETQIQRAILDYLNLRKGCVAWRVPVQGVSVKNRKTGKINYKPNPLKGMADIVCFSKDEETGTRCIFFEVKTPGGRQSQSQKDFQTIIENFCEYYIVTNVCDVVVCLNFGKGKEIISQDEINDLLKKKRQIRV